MRDFLFPNCGQHLAFENSVCLSCGSALGFSLDDVALLVISPGEESEHGGAVDSSLYQLCANLHVAECNWLVKVNPGRGAVTELCTSCNLPAPAPTMPIPQRWPRSPPPRRRISRTASGR